MNTSFSQADQDLFVMRKFSAIKRQKYFIEAGAGDGITISNTLLLEQRGNWTGLLVEPNDELFQQLIVNRPFAMKSNALLDDSFKVVSFWKRGGWMSGIVDDDTDAIQQKYKEAREKAKRQGHVVPMETKTLVSVLDSVSAPKLIDYFSLDVEGAEHRVITDELLEKYQFNVLGIERPKNELCSRLRRFGYHPEYEIPSLDVFFTHKGFPR